MLGFHLKKRREKTVRLLWPRPLRSPAHLGAAQQKVTPAPGSCVGHSLSSGENRWIYRHTMDPETHLERTHLHGALRFHGVRFIRPFAELPLS